MRIDQLPHSQIQELVKTGAPVFVFVNPVEFHGAHLSLNTDMLVSKGIAKEFYEKKIRTRHPEWPYLELASIELGVDPTPGPGSQKTNYKDLKKVILQCAQSLLRLDVKRVIWVSFHGAPSHNLAIQAGIDFLDRSGVPSFNTMNVVLEEMVKYRPEDFLGAVAHVQDASLREFLLGNMPKDFHGGFHETSMALYYAPESVSKNYQQMPDCPNPTLPMISKLALSIVRILNLKKLEKELEFGLTAMAWVRLKPFPGYTGTPRYASVQTGKFFADRLMEDLSQMMTRVFENHQKAPRPILEWSVLVSELMLK